MYTGTRAGVYIRSRSDTYLAWVHVRSLPERTKTEKVIFGGFERHIRRHASGITHMYKLTTQSVLREPYRHPVLEGSGVKTGIFEGAHL